jgi:hypothetical protein
MKLAPLPTREHERLRELLSLEILDTGHESQFDEIVQLASHICEAPITLVSLVDESRQWFKAKVGIDVTETPRDAAFCSHTLLEDDLLVVEDLRNDERFRENPFVTGDPNITFYAGSPLRTSNGYNIGTLCVLDTRKRQLTETQRTALQLLSRQVVKGTRTASGQPRVAAQEPDAARLPGEHSRDRLPRGRRGHHPRTGGLGPGGWARPGQQRVGGPQRLRTACPYLAETISEVLRTGKNTFVSSGSRQGPRVAPGALRVSRRNHPRRRDRLCPQRHQAGWPFERELKAAKETAERAYPGQEPVPGQHEPRDPHAHQRHPGLCPNAPPAAPAQAKPQEYLDHISASGELLLQLIGDVLDLTKIEEGKFELHEERFPSAKWCVRASTRTSSGRGKKACSSGCTLPTTCPTT